MIIQPITAFSALIFLTSITLASAGGRCETLFTNVPIKAAVAATAKANVSKILLKGDLSKYDNYHLKVSLGKISQEKFQQLHAGLKSSPELKYDSQRDYRLYDFLPPFAQSVLGKSLTPFEVSLPVTTQKSFLDKNIALEPNTMVDSLCHSTAWQWVNHMQGRSPKEALFFQVRGEIFDYALTDAPTVGKNELQPGDLVQIKGSTLTQFQELLHSAVYLGDGLIFEKGNPGAEYIYRIAHLSDLIDKYKSEVTDAEFIFRRVKNMATPLKTPEEALSYAGNALPEVPAAAVEGIDPHKFALVEVWDRESWSAKFFVSFLMNKNDVASHLRQVVDNP